MPGNRMNALRAKIRAFYGSEKLVFGEGSVSARLMLLGEAPGKDEIHAGRPFCGKAGKILDEFLDTAGMHRSALYLSNVCKFRPCRVSEKGTVANRPPEKEEIWAALPFLCEEIDIVRPELIVTLGNTPLRACFSDFSRAIGKLHGKKTQVRIGDVYYDLYPLYHPASVIYRPGLRQACLDDLRRLRGIVSCKG